MALAHFRGREMDRQTDTFSLSRMELGPWQGRFCSLPRISWKELPAQGLRHTLITCPDFPVAFCSSSLTPELTKGWLGEALRSSSWS